jgi:hypothetical protein
VVDSRKMIEEISNKNTKNEILEAYYELLEQVKQNKKITKQEEKAAVEKKVILEKATGHCADDIIKGLAELKLIINKSFKELEDQLLTENQKLIDLKQAIAICSQELEELYEIRVNADTLSALLLAQKEKTANFEKNMKERISNFEQEMQEHRSNWKKEQEEFDLAVKEQANLIKKLRDREEEEYIYKRNLTRAKEQDQYTQEAQALKKELADQRQKLEQEFKTREEQLVVAEQELNTLREQVKNFPAEKERIILEKEQTIKQELTTKYEYEAKLAQTKVEGEIKVYKQIISNLESKVTALTEQISQFNERADHANLQVQDIAIKAIEGASRQRYFQLEKLPENSKSTAS